MKHARTAPPSYRIELRQTIAPWLPRVGLPLITSRRWSERLLAHVMLGMAWSSEAVLGDRFAEARAAVVGMYESRRRPGETYAGFLAAMARHSATMVERIVDHLRARMAEHLGSHGLTGTRPVFTVDGSKVDCPRTRANQAHFQCGGRRKSGPQLLVTVLVHLQTGILWSWRQDRATGSERHLLRAMLGDLPAGSLLVADAGFVGYGLLREIFRCGHAILLRVGANVHLLQKLGYTVQEDQEDKDTVYLWPQGAQTQRQTPLALRRIVVRKGKQKMCLLTNLSQAELSDAQATELYYQRWGVELSYRGLKQTLDRGKMLSDSPRHAQVELDWTLLGQWILSLIQWTHQPARAKTPVHAGTAQTLRILRTGLHAGAARPALRSQLRAIRPDPYVRRRPKKARAWPHKKNERPCGLPQIRTATQPQVRLAKRLAAQEART